MEIQKKFIINPADLKLEQLLPNRPTVGNDVNVVLWRVIRLVGLYSILGDEAETVSYLTGKHIGKMLKITSVDDLGKQLTDLKIGKLSFPVHTHESVHMAIAECVTCDGISPALGRTVCQLEVGIVAGALENLYPNKKVSGLETKCIGGLGDPVCLIECSIL